MSSSARASNITAAPNLPDSFPPNDLEPQTPPYPSFPASIIVCFGNSLILGMFCIIFFEKEMASF